MADSPDSLPLAEQPPDDQALLARAFWLLLDHGRPVEVGALADALQREPAAVAAAVDRLEQAGLTRRDPAGRLLGSHGLSVAPTHHELVIDGRRRWTWCAYGRGPHPPAAALRVARRRPPVRRRVPMPIRIDLAQLQELLDGGGQLVEVLPAAEYTDEHLPGAISLPLKQLDATTAAQLDPARPVIVYCWDSL
jgi:hypothetical protein